MFDVMVYNNTETGSLFILVLLMFQKERAIVRTKESVNDIKQRSHKYHLKKNTLSND